ncbi:hypothetical protein STENO_004090 [Stenotrophomonas maltophilia]
MASRLCNKLHGNDAGAIGHWQPFPTRLFASSGSPHKTFTSRRLIRHPAEQGFRLSCSVPLTSPCKGPHHEPSSCPRPVASAARPRPAAGTFRNVCRCRIGRRSGWADCRGCCRRCGGSLDPEKWFEADCHRCADRFDHQHRLQRFPEQSNHRVSDSWQPRACNTARELDTEHDRLDRPRWYGPRLRQLLRAHRGQQDQQFKLHRRRSDPRPFQQQLQPVGRHRFQLRPRRAVRWRL